MKQHLMKDLHLTILHRNSKDLTDYVTHTYDLFGKLLQEMGLIK